MEKVDLSKKCKKILSQLRGNKRELLYKDGDYEDIKYLISIGFITGCELMHNNYTNLKLTDKGRQYLYENPNLKNPSIWDDWKYWITTAISFAALIVSFIALLKD